MARTFELSYDRLDAADDTDVLARGLLARVAYFAPGEPIVRELLLATVDLEGEEGAILAEDALARLSELGILESEESGALRLHRLLAAFVRQVETDGPAIQRVVEEAILTEAGRVNGDGYAGPLLVWQPHLRAVTDAARSREDERAAGLCNELGYHLRMIGDDSGARPYLERTLAIREQILGADYPTTAISLNNLGSLLQDQGDYSGARPYLERALQILRAALGEKHPYTKTVQANLASIIAEGERSRR